MSNNENFDEIMAKYKEEDKKFLEEILTKIENGEHTTWNYYFVFEQYQSIQEKDEHKKEIDKYAQLTIDAALNDINTNNNPAQAYVCLAIVYDYKKDKEKTFKYINQAIELEPDKADKYLLRGNFFNKYGYKERADIDYNKACELDPSMHEHIDLLRRTDKLINQTKWFVWIFYAILTIIVISIIYPIFVK